MSTSEFPVDIEDSLSVGHLKREITKKISYTSPGVDADQLTLWKVGSFSDFPHNFSIKFLFRPSDNSRTALTNISFSKKSR